MPTSTEHIAARDDLDLQLRLIAVAEQLGYANAQSLVVSNLGSLVSKSFLHNGSETTVATVHAYAANVRKEYLADERAMPPGLNPGAVTDDHIRAALAAVLGVVEGSGA